MAQPSLPDGEALGGNLGLVKPPSTPTADRLRIRAVGGTIDPAEIGDESPINAQT
jgi:hypothetical protein